MVTNRLQGLLSGLEHLSYRLRTVRILTIWDYSYPTTNESGRLTKVHVASLRSAGGDSSKIMIGRRFLCLWSRVSPISGTGSSVSCFVVWLSRWVHTVGDIGPVTRGRTSRRGGSLPRSTLYRRSLTFRRSLNIFGFVSSFVVKPREWTENRGVVTSRRTGE